MKLIHRPIDAWPGELLADAQREQSRFSASWTQTLNLLDREVDHLGGREVVLQVAVTGLIGTAYRLGSKLLHPDNGGDPEAFRRLTEARDLLMGSA